MQSFLLCWRKYVTFVTCGSVELRRFSRFDYLKPKGKSKYLAGSLLPPNHLSPRNQSSTKGGADTQRLKSWSYKEGLCWNWLFDQSFPDFLNPKNHLEALLTDTFPGFTGSGTGFKAWTVKQATQVILMVRQVRETLFNTMWST